MRRAIVLLAILLPLGLSSCRQLQGPPAVKIGDHVWQVELAMDRPSRERGMGGRKNVPPGTGMLFVFPREEVVAFHMLDCYAPLDVAFISADGVIVEIRGMSVEDCPAKPKVLYPSRYGAQYALEVAEGELRKAGVKVGDKVELLGAAAGAAKDAR
jgi:uncharacterized protein